MKFEKARAWMNVAVARIPHKVSSIIYPDIDIVIAKDLTNFLSRAQNLESKGHTLALFKDQDNSVGEIHTGIVVMFDGELTDKCLYQWAKKICGRDIHTVHIYQGGGHKFDKDIDDDNTSEDPEMMEIVRPDTIERAESFEKASVESEDFQKVEVMGWDQQSLGTTKACRHAGNGCKFLQSKYLWLPIPYGMKKNNKAEFVHITNTYHWAQLSHSEIAGYLERIGVPKEIDPTAHHSC
eukprot:gnl/MRDRNA2_/MRDRNA2_162198_c0_seq1.p1 gnl/MRDRNA2_/MRDRNA2_162198_c0~~gnl/MRDRNA2_/MRDRNA2_162198_c0_seq1.p1  ORF type:complete len:238 (-),score=45.53 gnl/MRDRNA2_/MRDRNA2_162198_c0_seq1:45-758(-)